MYEFLPHTADVRIRVRAPDLESLFRDALHAVCALVGAAPSGPPVRHTISIEATDATSLLVDFLNEALLRLHLHRETLDEVEFTVLTSERLEASLTGSTAGDWREDVKAVTYHEADVTMRDGEWSTLLVLDI